MVNVIGGIHTPAAPFDPQTPALIFDVFPQNRTPTVMQELQYIEMFAGEGNCWKAVSTAYPSARVDLDYYDPKPGTKEAKKQNPMDFLSPPGLASIGCTLRLDTLKPNRPIIQ